MPTPYTGFKAMRAGLITDTYLEVHTVERHKKSYLDFVPDDEMAQKISDAADEDMCAPLPRSPAPPRPPPPPPPGSGKFLSFFFKIFSQSMVLIVMK